MALVYLVLTAINKGIRPLFGLHLLLHLQVEYAPADLETDYLTVVADCEVLLDEH